MDLGKAWIALGRDPEEAIEELRAHGSVRERIAAAEVLLQEAEKTARVLMGRYHPDVNPDNPKAAERFRRVSDAIDVIRSHTKALKLRTINNNQPVIIKVV